MDVLNFVAGIVGGALGGSAFAGILVNTLKDRWMERVKANYATDLEQLKNTFAGNQAALQAQLNQGTHVTTAQYDLELSSYQALWEVQSNLRESWKSLFAQSSFLAQAQGQHKNDVLEQATKDLGAANDQSVLVCGKLSPFYEKSIRDAARSVNQQSYEFLCRLNEWGNSPSTVTPEETASRETEMNTRLIGILNGVEHIDDLIRDRLTSLRIVKS
jgi:hypothetical protein